MFLLSLYFVTSYRQFLITCVDKNWLITRHFPKTMLSKNDSHHSIAWITQNSNKYQHTNSPITLFKHTSTRKKRQFRKFKTRKVQKKKSISSTSRRRRLLRPPHIKQHSYFNTPSSIPITHINLIDTWLLQLNLDFFILIYSKAITDVAKLNFLVLHLS